MLHREGSIACAGLLLAAAMPVQAQDATMPLGASAQGDVSVTIYNNDQALVQDVRQLAIPRGRSTVVLPDVSARIRPETLGFATADAGIVEQNFDFDLLTPGSLMEKAVGRPVTLIRTNPGTGAEVRERATVLSTAGGVVVQIGERIEVLRDDGLPVRVIFDEVPPNLRARPTLSVTVDSTAAGSRPVAIRYLTTGLAWNADYVALFDEAAGTMAMQGWITLNNQTGTTFSNARTLLVAGSPGTGQPQYGPTRRAGVAPFQPGTGSAQRERVGDYYLYPLAQPTTIASNQTKQVSFLDVQGVPARRAFFREVPWLTSDEAPVNATSLIQFSTGAAGPETGLGDALPAGTVRFYQRDQAGNPQFIGEDQVRHSPAGSQLGLTTGEAFDITVEAQVTARERISAGEFAASARYRVTQDDGSTSTATVEQAVEYWRTTMRYTLTNARSQPVEVDLLQSGLSNNWWLNDTRAVQESVMGRQLDADRRLHVVPVPANGRADVTVTYETRY
ncbi:DUF4139 domain-containing protein [Croceibacterium mercuriale]|uniref:DUF4139 domain-containing protein n=1 Tax=Croceibacterium mercuriale TaxID=1572751 RepID=UPI00068D505A|nr:DUF4139 domain-containing protein [Croceibacterium mercuriale]